MSLVLFYVSPVHLLMLVASPPGIPVAGVEYGSSEGTQRGNLAIRALAIHAKGREGVADTADTDGVTSGDAAARDVWARVVGAARWRRHDEAARFTARLRPLVEAGERVDRAEEAYLWAVKHARGW